MSAEYQDNPKQKKRASDQKNARETDLRAAKRLSERRRGCRPKARNALYQIVAEYRQRHPKTSAADVWRHLIAVAKTGAHPVVIAHDPVADVLEYLPDLDRRTTRTVARRTFFNQWYRLSVEGDKH